MRIFVEGMDWMGRWTEITVDALRDMGHSVDFFYHNKKDLSGRLSSKMHGVLSRLHIKSQTFQPWEELARKRLVVRLAGNEWDLLLSVQGKLDRETVARIRQAHPDIKIVCWWGDPLTSKAEKQIFGLLGLVDMHLLSCRVDHVNISKKIDPQHAMYFPFAVSVEHYTNINVTSLDRKKYEADVSFIGSYAPERCDLLQKLNAKLTRPVQVWGRSWRKCSGLDAKGYLPLEETFKVYACSKISLNINQAHGRDALNMKFYEIPAAGGFEICDAQPALCDMDVGRHMVTFQTPDELAEKLDYYLQAVREREAIRKAVRDSLMAHDTYQRRFEHLFNHLQSLG